MTKKKMYELYVQFKAAQEGEPGEHPEMLGRQNFFKLVAALTRATKHLTGVSYYLGKNTIQPFL